MNEVVVNWQAEDMTHLLIKVAAAKILTEAGWEVTMEEDRIGAHGLGGRCDVLGYRWELTDSPGTTVKDGILENGKSRRKVKKCAVVEIETRKPSKATAAKKYKQFKGFGVDYYKLIPLTLLKYKSPEGKNGVPITFSLSKAEETLKEELETML